MGVLAAPHFDPREIALAGQLDRARELLTGNFDTFALDCLLPRERRDLGQGAVDLRLQSLRFGIRFLPL